MSVWIARYLGPTKFGLLSFATAYTGIFGTFTALGLQNIVIRDLIREPELAGVTLGTTAFLQLMSGFIAYIFCIILIFYLRPSDSLTHIIVSILGSIMLFKCGEIAVYWFESLVQSKYTILVQNIIFIFFVLIKVVLIQQKASMISFVWATLAEAIIVSSFLLFVMFRIGNFSFKLSISINRAKNLLLDCWPLIFSSIAISINMKIDQIMLGQMIGDQSVGIFSAAVRISEVWYFTIGIIMSSIFPILTKIHSTNKNHIHKKWIFLYRIMFIFSLIISIIFTLFASQLVEILFGHNYSESVLILKVHVWAGINVAIGSVWSYWILLENKLKISLYGQIIAAILNIACNLILIPKFGALGSAIATLISYTISSLISYTLYKPRIFLNYIKEAFSPLSLFKELYTIFNKEEKY